MRLLLSALLFLAVPAQAGTYKTQIDTAATVGISAAACLGGVTTNPLQMVSDVLKWDDIDFDVSGTPGTTTAVVVTCKYSSTSGGTYRPIYKCSGDAAATCATDTRTYGFDSAGFASQWKRRGMWMKCTFTCTGTGTISVGATRTRE